MLEKVGDSMLCIIDLDGSVCDWRARAKKAGVMPSRHHKDHFQAWLDAVQSEKSLAKDKPITEVVNIIDSLMQAGHLIVFLTGRSEKYRTVTERWIQKTLHLFNPRVIMRNETDFRSAADYKRAALKGILRDNRGPVLAVDDDYDGDTAEVYRKLGIVHLKVMELPK